MGTVEDMDEDTMDDTMDEDTMDMDVVDTMVGVGEDMDMEDMVGVGEEDIKMIAQSFNRITFKNVGRREVTFYRFDKLYIAYTMTRIVIESFLSKIMNALLAALKVMV
jgi:hypothetical protein